MPATPSRPLDDRDAELEVVPAVAVAEPATNDGPPRDFMQEILDDHATYRAVHDCPWFDQLAYRAGSAVSATHPGVAGWLGEGLIERTDTEAAAPQS